MPGMKYPWYGPIYDVLGEQDSIGSEGWLGAMQYGEERPTAMQRFDQLPKVIGGLEGMQCNRSENFREMLKQAYSMAEKTGPVVLDCIVDRHLVNKAVIGPVYSLMYAHLPWDELPLRGKHSRRSTLKRWFLELQKLPEMPIFDSWEAVTEKELGYESKK